MSSYVLMLKVNHLNEEMKVLTMFRSNDFAIFPYVSTKNFFFRLFAFDFTNFAHGLHLLSPTVGWPIFICFLQHIKKPSSRIPG